MDQAKRLALRGGLMLLMIWVVMIVIVYVMPMAFPEFISASFFSSSLVEPSTEFSLAEIYFTANPFESLSSNVVPAVVLFSCMFGVALMGLKRKAALLEPLRVWNQAIVNITNFVISLTPFGVFALSAATAGTMSLDTLVRLEAYFVVFAAAAGLLGFVILPLLVTAVTPFRYGEVVGIAKDALLTAFVAHSAFIVLPILVQRSKELFERHGLLNDETDSAADVMIPVLFNFPNAGKLLTLLFIPFAAWLSGAPLIGTDYGTLIAAGIPSYFAKAQIALPYLLDLMGLPHDLFRLYIPTTIVTGKFDSMVTAMNLLVFALLGAGAMSGFLVFERRRILRAAAAIAGSLVITVLAARLILGLTIDTSYRMDEALRSMHAPQGNRDDIVVHRQLLPPAPTTGAYSRRAQIVERGTVRVGYDGDNLPFSFFNSDDELVGFDVELATRLVRSVGLTPEFVPVTWEAVPKLLEQGVIDVMPGIWYRPNWFGLVRLSAPYMVGTMALVVRDERRDEFDRVDKLRRSRGLKVAVPLDQRQVQYSMERYFGGADVEFVVVDFWQSYFEGKHPDVDAFLMPAEHASGWSLIHPEFAVVVPQPDPVRVSTAFGVPWNADELVTAINEWTVFAANTGEIDTAYDYWVLGSGAEDTTPRWSIMRNVLGWGSDTVAQDGKGD